MKKWNKSLMTIAAGICIGTAGFAATALAAPPQPEAGPGYADDARHEARWSEMMARRQAELHDKLKLSANQEGAWKTYSEATIKNLTPAKPASPVNFDNMPAPDRMQKMLDFSKERQAKMEAQLDVLKAFYATLTPEQQKIFDTETSPRNWRKNTGEYGKKRPRPEGK